MKIEAMFRALRNYDGNKGDKVREFAINEAFKLLKDGGVEDPPETLRKENLNDEYHHPKFIYFPTQSLVVMGEKEVHLTPIQNKLLNLFTESPNMIVSHGDICLRVWGDNEYDPLRNESVRVQMSRLRKKLGQTAQDGEGAILVNRVGIGYMLVDPTKLKCQNGSR